MEYKGSCLCINGNIHIKPSGHIFYAHKANWDEDLGAVIKFDELPPTDK